MSPYPSTPVKLLALDEDDLKVLSVHLQDAVMRLCDMAYLPSEHKFAAILNRFDWLAAETNGAELRRCRCALRLERVLRAQVQGIDLNAQDGVAAILAVTYEETDPPSGLITLHFCGGGAVRLEVECIEAELKDLGAVWQTTCKPKHNVIDIGEDQAPQFDKAS